MTTTVDYDLTLAQRKLDELDRVLRSVRSSVGNTLDVRRVCGDVERLRDSLALLCEHAPRGGGPSAHGPAGLETISELPYDPALFADADDEGVGGMRPQRP
ncbi:hypothetical protein [Yinghuangia seranimata]|uniref:hypothetical protein n=1 Tax=Yinghuangia seranimata TaxID=408067 RepID=UPI00248BDDC5|nr:hypothetical protein [Yinghuangia seranimata]MDI2128905.1 hypothetical protein [Yinghuangia seranimata]